MASSISCVIAAIILVLRLHNVNSAAGAGAVPVPALLWSPERSMTQLPEIGGVNAVNTGDFLKQYLEPLMASGPDSAVVFLQDKLHTDDFTNYADVYSLDSEGGAFKNIKHLMEDHFSLELPQVSDPHGAVEKLKGSFKGDVHTVQSAAELKDLGLVANKKFLLIVLLDPVSGQKDKEQAIQKNDATIGEISGHLKKRSIKYTALFTGQSAGDVVSEEAESHSSRHLMADVSEEKANGTFMNVSGEIFVFMREAFVCVKQKDQEGCPLNFTLVPGADTAGGSKKDNGTATIELHWPTAKSNSSTEVYDIKITTEASSRGDRWVMERIYLDVGGGAGAANNSTLKNATLNPGDMDFVVPTFYSFHCTDMKMYVDVKYDKKKYQSMAGSYVSLRGYQLQAFNIQQDRFFNAQDCVGFFTRAIWMGLFPVAVLLIILLFGTLMVLDLSIMDKYDDPKGKTITVAQAQE